MAVSARPGWGRFIDARGGELGHPPVDHLGRSASYTMRTSSLSKKPSLIARRIPCSISDLAASVESVPAPAVDTGGEGNGGGTGSGSGGGNGEGVELDLNPLLIAPSEKIPSTEKGWTGPNRLRWFRTFAMNVSQIYDADDNEAVEMKIELEPKEAAN